MLHLSQLEATQVRGDRAMTQKARILCVEDNPLNRRLITRILTHGGYEVLLAGTGNAGLAAAHREQPDVILLDINLPDIDGLEVAQRLKADETLKGIPLIAVTANGMHGDREICLKAGCDGYIAKPIARIELLNTIECLMRAVEA